MLPTFAFEVDFINTTGNLIQGWLFDESKDTQYYLLNWINAKKDNDIIMEDINGIGCLLINRRSLLSFLESQGLDWKNVKRISTNIRTTGIDGRHMKGDFDSCYFYYSLRGKSERPVNIVIYKEKLDSLADKKFSVFKDGVILF